MKQHETRRYEVLLKLRPAETLPPAYEMDLPLAACLAEDGRETQAYDTEARKTHLFGKPVGNIRLQVQAYDAMTLVLIVTETMEDASDAIVETAGEPVHLPQLAGQMPETAWKMVVANDVDASIFDFCLLVIERLKTQVPALAKLKNRLRADYSEFEEIYDSHYVRLEIDVVSPLSVDIFEPPWIRPGNIPVGKPREGQSVTRASCIWKKRDASLQKQKIDIRKAMGQVLLEEYETESPQPYCGDLSVWLESDYLEQVLLDESETERPQPYYGNSFVWLESGCRYVFMKCGVAAGSKWAQAPGREDAVVIPCEPDKTVQEHLEAAMGKLRRLGRRRR